MDVKLEKCDKTTWDGKPMTAVVEAGVTLGWVYKDECRDAHSTNNVLTHYTTRRGWKYELSAKGTDMTSLPTADLRVQARHLRRCTILWDTRKRAVVELLKARDAIARLRG